MFIKNGQCFFYSGGHPVHLEQNRFRPSDHLEDQGHHEEDSPSPTQHRPRVQNTQ